MRRARHLSLPLALFGFALASPAAAQTPPAPADASPPEPPKKNDVVEVRVIGDKADSLQKIPGSGTIITKQQIERADPSGVGEMLRRVPGVQVREETGGGGRLDIGIRGLESGRSRRVLVLEDGIPVALNPYAEPDMYYAPPIERMRGIEVVKGSGSILFGPQTIGGVVNFLTLAPPEARHAVVDFEGGQLGYLRGLANYGDTFGTARYVVQAMAKRGDGFREERFATLDTFTKIAFPTSERGEATFKVGYHHESNDSDDVGLTRDMYAADPRRGTISPNGHLKLDRYEASVIHEHTFSKDTKLKTLFYAYDLGRIWRRQDYVRAPTPGTAYEHVAGDTQLPNGAVYFENSDTILDRDYQVAGIEPRLEQRLRTGPVGHTFDVGARLLGEAAHYQQRSGQNPFSYSGTLDYEEQHRTIALAGYVQDRVAFTDKLLVTPGFRYEHAEFHRSILRQGGQDVDIAGDSSASGLIPGIGMIYGTRKAHVFGGLHVGWAPPRITSSISPKGVPAELSAEESINYEVGSRLAPTKWLRAEATGFLSNFENQVVLNTSPGAATTEADGGHTRHIGVESAAILGLGKLLEIPTTVDVGARYTFARATFLDGANSGNLLPYAPLHTFGGTLDVEQPVRTTGVVGGEVAYQHVSNQYTDTQDTVAPDATGRVGLMPAYNIVDVTAHYKHKPTGLSLRLTVKNALDDVYIVARRPEGIFASGFRLIYVGLRWEYDKAASDESAK